MTSPAPSRRRRSDSPPRLLRLARAVAAALVAAHAGPSCAEDAAPLFDGAWIPRIEIRLAEGAADRLRAEPRTRVPCTLAIRPLGDEGAGPEIHEDVAIRLKGSAGSFQGLDDKPGFTLDMDAWRDGRRFRGLDKFHLNNAAQDPTFLHEWLGGELFRAAGIPAARVGHARVILDDRDLGVYVLKEALDRDFLERHFDRPDGNLYDGNGVDLDGLAERDEGRIGPPGADVARLVEACRTEDPAARRALVDERLDVEQFIGFMAMELATAHWDGATTGANNYRVYFDPARDGRSVYIPHGMDQLFGDPGFPILDLPGTLAAGAVMGDPEWRGRYRERVRELLPLFAPDRLLPAIDAAAARLRPALVDAGPEALAGQEEALADLRARVAARHASLVEQAEAPEPGPMPFDGARRAALGGWAPRVDDGEAILEELEGEDGRRVLSIACAGEGPARASWRTSVILEPGRYLLAGLARGTGIEPLDDEQGSGAGLRVSGGVRSGRLEREGTWDTLSHEFEVDAQGRVELVAELRATAGAVRFNAESLVLVRLSDP
ncbi:MAG: CotH kinase family protein [Planctomycetaceae bacterium]